ncbi:MAG: ParB N-terminal domain-containing protein [Hyphomicrobiales bacterium]
MPHDPLQVEQWPADRLLPYAANARTHSDDQVAQIAGSIAEFGFNVPCLVDEKGVLIAGHGRLLAARNLGLDTVPVIRLEHLTEAQARAFRIADNQLALNAGWDEDLLRTELQELNEDGVDLELLGFAERELAELLGGLGAGAGGAESDVGDDAAPEPPERPVSRLGDLWLLGEHRLLCGDSTKADDVSRLMMGGETAALFATDPPYLVDYTGADRLNGGHDWSDLYREVDIKDAEGFLRAVFAQGLAVCRNDAAWYCWQAHKRAALIEQIWSALGVLNHQQIIWVKPAAIPTHSYYPWRHEPCLMGWKQGHKPSHSGDNSHAVTSVWELDWEGNARLAGAEHPTQKPIEVFAIPMRRHTRSGEVCYEPFSGSGSQIIAGERLGRRVQAMELQPAFVDVALRRWQEATGQAATLDGDGRAFEEIAKDRGT